MKIPTPPRGRPATVTAHVRARAEERPGAPAVDLGPAGVVTYGELVDRATRVAAGLASRGVVPGDRVVVCLRRDRPDLVPALLGVVLAGASYVPVDPRQPGRIVPAALDSGAKVIVTDAPDVDVPGVTVVPAAELARDAAGTPPDGAEGTTSGEDELYVMYTSGSTGVPKGVRVPHRAILRLVTGRDVVPLGPEERMLQVGSLSFDASAWEIWSALVNGGCLVPADEGPADADHLASVVAGRGVTTALLTTSLFHSLVDAGFDFSPLRSLVVGGEALSPVHAARALSRAPGLLLVNAYGPTECGVIVTAGAVDPASAREGRASIGRPVSGVRVVVDDPDGVGQGELLVGGECLFLGYLGRPDEDAARLVTRTDDEGVPSTYYKTGDVVAPRPDGSFDFVGRTDAQVKVRGIRIECEAIERLLAGSDGVAAAAVCAAEGPSEKTLEAWIVPSAGGSGGADTESLARAVREAFGDLFVPQRWHRLARLPLTPSGKLDRKALAGGRLGAGTEGGPAPRGTDAPPTPESVRAVFEEILGSPYPDPAVSFFAAGGSSLRVVRLTARLREAFPGACEASGFTTAAVYARPDARSLAAYLSGAGAAAPDGAAGPGSSDRPPSGRSSSDRAGRVAVVGMAGRFPGAPSVARFWQNLLDDVDGMTEFTDENTAPDVSADVRGSPDYVARRGACPDYDRFDARFFGVSDLEASSMDPQHRVLLETAWHALEDAGVVPGRGPAKIGVYAGASDSDYAERHVAAHPASAARLGRIGVHLANESDYLASRIAYKLDLRGPAVTVHTSSSTSLVAIAEAYAAVSSGMVDVAVAGGVSIASPSDAGYVADTGGMLSPDGRCLPFDAEARGTVFSDGAALVVLKPLDDALRDGDRIYAVLRGAAMNNDGADKSSFTAPSGRGQTEVIRDALSRAGVGPGDLTFVEAHGTGTPLGDPIEFRALADVLGGAPSGKKILLTAVKGHIGHLRAASGATGFVKACMALSSRVLPGVRGLSVPHPELGAARSPLVLVRGAEPLPDGTLFAGVSSFGVGGTNVHVVLESPPPRPAAAPDPVPAGSPELVLYSAASEEALLRQRRAEKDRPDPLLPSTSYTRAARRPRLPLRAFAIEDGRGERKAVGFDRPEDVSAAGRLVTFLFPGQGSQFLGMGRGLAERSAVFRETWAWCDEIVRDETGSSFAGGTRDASEVDTAVVAQPAIFAYSMGVCDMLAALGVTPDVCVGHSLGEYAAAAAAGFLPREAALRIVALRAAAAAGAAPGAMLAVRSAAAEVAALLPEGLSVAASNTARSCTVSGPSDAVKAFAADLAARGTAAVVVPSSVAFHSPLMDPVLGRFRSAVAEKLPGDPRPSPSAALYSCVTGAPVTPSDLTPDHWARHLREPVRWFETVSSLDPATHLFVEAGPGDVLTLLLRQTHGSAAAVPVVRSGKRAESEQGAFLEGAGELWRRGARADVAALWAGRPVGHADVPLYPFVRERHWLPRAAAATHGETAARGAGGEGAAAAEQSEARAEPQAQGQAQAQAQARDTVGVVLSLVEELTGTPPDPAHAALGFFSLGLDSLALTQFAQLVSKRFKQKVTFRELMEGVTTPAALAERLGAAPVPVKSTAQAPVSTPPAAPPAAAPAGPAAAPGPMIRITKEAGAGFTDEQAPLVRDFFASYDARHRRSKESTARHRDGFADPRTASGFGPLWKEITYPIVVERSAGSRMWDVDGNEFIDLTSGFGSNILGFSPPDVVAAMARQLALGYEIGPSHPLAGEVVSLVRELTGAERVAFAATGSEAVMGAIRLARTVTGRDLIVTFSADYHGIFDEVVVHAGKENRGFPSAPGIPADATRNQVVLPWGRPEALELLAGLEDDIAAFVVEPVQGRNPGVQPRELIRAVREFATENGSALVFDEIVTGFRLGLRGAQGFYGVDADMAVYGKVAGGGMPLGLITGKREYLDALDGGTWRYGDDSRPEAGVTFFAGTFVRHPLMLAASHAALSHLKEHAATLYPELERRSATLVRNLQRLFVTTKAPLRAERCGSLFKISYQEAVKGGELFFPALRAEGLHVWDRPCFLTAAHTDEDVEAITSAFGRAIAVMERLRIFAGKSEPKRPAAPSYTPPVPGAKLGRDSRGNPGWYVADPESPGKYKLVAEVG